jgi:hypothetical protein
VVVEAAADGLLEELLQAATSIAALASGRPTPSVRSEVLRSMTILPMWCGPITGPHVNDPVFGTGQVAKRIEHASEAKITFNKWLTSCGRGGQ